MEEFLQKNFLLLAGLLLGLIFLGGGLLGLKIFQYNESPKVEILGEEAEETIVRSTTVKVEIAGAVVKPGVYELPDGSRINDLLTLAGGLAAKANREWVSQSINLAQKLIDGTKVYIPEVGSIQPKEVSQPSGEAKKGEKVNLNTASLTELDRLWGVGAVTAQKIIDGRPWGRPEELLEKKVIKKNVWESIKDQVSVY
jgi:competence protein ComEA